MGYRINEAETYILVDTPATLKQVLEQLRDAPLFAVDTESDSLYAYFEKVCLLQLSIPGADYLVDPLRVDVTPLGELFASQDHEKVFHAASYDILCLKRDYGFTFVNIFDTMVAARILGWRHYGLAAILQEQFGVHVDKRLQRYNWGARPLSTAALEYARLDTHYLLPLRDLQIQELQRRGKLIEARHAFARESLKEPATKSFDPEGFWRISGVLQLDPVGRAILRELYILRDKLAREMDLPPFKVISNDVLVHLAVTRPSSRRELLHIKGLGQGIYRRCSDELLEAIARGRRALTPSPLRDRRPSSLEITIARYEALRAWRRQEAEARQVDPDIILPNRVLIELARRSPITLEALAQIETMDEWQRQTYGEAVVAVLQRWSG